MRDMMQNVESGRKSVSTPPHKEALFLKTLIEGAEKSIDAIIKDIEDNDYNNQLKESYKKDDLKSPSSKYLFDIKIQMLEIKGDLGDAGFGSIASVVGKIILASAGVPVRDSFIDHYVTKVAEALRMEDYEEKVVKTDNGCKIYVKDLTNGRHVVFYVDNNLFISNIRLVGKTASLIPYMSQAYVQAILLPVLKKVGHVYVPSQNKILIPASADLSDAYSLACFDAKTGSPYACKINYMGFGGPKRKTVKLSFEGVSEPPFALRMESALNKRYEEIMSAQMVKCTRDGKYKGIAGKIHRGDVVIRNDHIEVPVTFEYDNGFRDKVVLTDDDVALFV
jgi:hypothetical protein